MYHTAEEIIDLDVGGTHMITTTKKTLMRIPGSVLEAMFSGRHQLSKHNGRIFIDRDGRAFQHMINYLRSSQKPPFESDPHSGRLNVRYRGEMITEEERMFYRELDYWGIPYPDQMMSEGDDEALVEERYEFN